jgi:ribosomal protein S18 acetylase RimI-like enzyme
MPSDDPVSYSVHDDAPAHEASLVDAGLDAANVRAAPLHEVRPLSCFARSGSEQKVVGGAVGRTWGPCCELQQIWVEPGWRHRGIATRLIRMFEARAQQRGCHTFYLETFTFQAPELYRRLGYEVHCELAVYPHGIARYTMVRRVEPR